MKFLFRPKRKFPISLTLVRFILAIIISLLIYYDQDDAAIYLFVVTGILSFFENFINKLNKSQVRIILDTLADKLLVNATAITLVVVAKIPLWIAAIFLIRDAATVIAGAYTLRKNPHYELRRSLIGKITLFVQLIALLLVLVSTIDWVVMGAALFFTIISSFELMIRSEFKRIRRSDLSEFNLARMIKLADLLTLLNVLFGIGAIMLVLNNQVGFAMIALVLAVVADFFDGKVARLLKQQNNFGKELDSLADTISFGVAPTVIGFSLIQTPLAIIAFTIFLFCGILRLARYNVMGKIDEYAGMPITFNGLFIPLAYALDLPIPWYPYLFLILGLLMISSLKLKKW